MLRSTLLLIACLAAVAGCSDGSRSVTVGQDGNDPSEIHFPSSTSTEFEAAIEAGADPSGPRAETIPGVGVVVGAPAAVPQRLTADEDIDSEHEASFVQEPAFYLAWYDGADPIRVSMPDDVSHLLRQVVAAGGSRDRVVVAFSSCAHAYYYEAGDTRPYDCTQELWAVTSGSDVATPISLPDEIAASSSPIFSISASESLIRVNHENGMFQTTAKELSWQRLGDGVPTIGGPNRMCTLADGTIVGLDPTNETQLRILAPSEDASWTELVSEPAAPTGLNELLCGPNVAYRVSFGPSNFKLVRATVGETTAIDNPLAAEYGPTRWKVDQITGDLAATVDAEGSGSMLRWGQQTSTIETIEATEAEYIDSSGERRQFVTDSGVPYERGSDGSLTLKPRNQ